VSFPFDGDNGLVIVRAELFGPSGTQVLRLALDTGATATLINVGPLATVGYDPALTSERVQVTTGSNVEFLPQVEIARLSALGQTRMLSLSLLILFRQAPALMDYWGWTFYVANACKSILRKAVSRSTNSTKEQRDNRTRECRLLIDGPHSSISYLPSPCDDDIRS
jgi:hypothetical protein